MTIATEQHGRQTMPNGGAYGHRARSYAMLERLVSGTNVIKTTYLLPFVRAFLVVAER